MDLNNIKRYINQYASLQGNAFENVPGEMETILFRRQWVKTMSFVDWCAIGLHVVIITVDQGWENEHLHWKFKAVNEAELACCCFS